MADRKPSANAQLKIRVRETSRQKLEEAARLNEWPLNREIVTRLDRSLDEDESLGGRQTTAFLRLLAAQIADVEARTGHDWSTDHTTWEAATLAIISLLQLRRPEQEGAGEILEQIISDIRDRATPEGAAVADRILEDRNKELVSSSDNREE